MDGWTLAATLMASTTPIVGLGLAAYVADVHKRLPDGEAGSTASPQAQRSSPSAKFARDVAVNVIANLVAAAIIYLLAAGFGLLPRSPYLIFTALTVVVMTAGCGLGLVGLALRGDAKIYTLGAAMIAMGASGVLAPFIKDSGLTGWEKFWLPIGSVGAFSMGLITIATTRRLRRNPPPRLPG
ncbi:hypothetical protein ACPB67_26625 [Micromonospora taraxaci]|uniref:hypothetical protein n=1 Tax=Micromonospora taraxaci TaxID=1316803 RepID=UPI003C2B2BF6